MAQPMSHIGAGFVGGSDENELKRSSISSPAGRDGEKGEKGEKGAGRDGPSGEKGAAAAAPATTIKGSARMIGF